MNTATLVRAEETAYDEDTSRIAERERARRLEAVNYARASVGLEGFKSNPAADAHDQRFINGEISLAEYVKN